jgi:hypothetical protein
VNELKRQIEALQSQGSLTLPLPGGGRTAERHQFLLQIGRRDLSLARLVEAHTDAMAILAEAGRQGRRDHLYGVWASDGPQGKVMARALAGGGWRIGGIKQYCSGAPLLESALVTAHAQDGLLLFEVELDRAGIVILPSTWASPAMADTVTTSVSFDGVELPATALVAGSGWYLTRPGFWHGAIGPAACWAGGALALIDAASALKRKDPHSRAHLGALQALAWGFHAALIHSGHEIDSAPTDPDEGRQRALKVRHLIERGCTEVMDRFGRLTGPQLLAFDESVVRQYGALTLYIRQCHAERDLEALCPP